MCSRCVFLLLNILQTLKSERVVALAPMPSSAPLCCCHSQTDKSAHHPHRVNAFGHRYTNQEARTLQDVMPHFGLWNKCIHILMVSWQEFWRLYKMKKTWNTSYRTPILCTITYKIFKIQKFVILMKWYNSKTVLYIFYNCYTSTKARGILIYQYFCIIIYFWYYVCGHS